MQGTPDEYVAIYFREHEYYLDYYKSYREGRKGQFNIAAFFAAGFWLLYRKMYFYALLYLFGLLVCQILLSAILLLFNVTNVDSIIAWQILLSTALSITSGFLGNRIYMNKALREIRSTLQKYPQEVDRTRKLRKTGGTSFLFVFLLILEFVLLDMAI